MLTAIAIVRNLPYLRSEVKLESVVSRESSFLFNNVILLASCFAVLWGTLFPVIMEALSGEKETIDAPYYNRVNIPIALFLLFLTGVGPLIAWRKSSLSSLRRAFMVPTVIGVVVIAGLAIAGIHDPAPLISFGLCAFVLATILGEFWKGSRAIQLKEQLPLPKAVFQLTWRNTRRYGGYLVHIAIVFMFIGFTGSAFNLHETHNLGLGQSVRFGAYQLKLLSVNSAPTSNYDMSRAVLEVSKNGASDRSTGTGSSLLQGQPAAKHHGRHPPPPERRSVRRLLRRAARSKQGHFPVLSESAGVLDLDRLLPAPVRHHHLPHPEQGASAICKDGGGRYCSNACANSVLKRRRENIVFSARNRGASEP